MRELIYKDEAYKAIDNCICDSWHRISPTDAKMNIYHLVSDANADRPQGEWIESFKPITVKQEVYLGTKFVHDGWSCSVCSEYVEKRYPNCPYCLARMKGADDEASD